MAISSEAQEEKINHLRSMIRDNGQILCLCGVGMEIECGGKNLWSNDEAYRIEEEYGLSPEEIYSGSFYATKKQKFYQFYRKEIMDVDIKPGPGYYAIKHLQDLGKLSAVVTHDVLGLPEDAGIYNVIRLHGNRHVNRCPKCHRLFDLSFMREHKGIPLCDECQAPIRPMIQLHGEMVRNDVMTAASNAVVNANIILVLGTNLSQPMVNSLLQYYEGSHMVLITLHEHHSDSNADICIHGKVEDILPMVVY
ncbi:MAG: NAD-dependent deacetylase [Lachnospiraceae bacterium]|nr:NAD-dependent deacetylase [Lachnospiraceae bacterium]